MVRCFIKTSKWTTSPDFATKNDKMDRICNCPKIVTTNLKKYGIISEIQFGGVIMESGKTTETRKCLTII